MQAVIVEMNGSGSRYQTSERDVHEQLTRFGFAPYRYAPFTRQLVRLQVYDGVKANAIYIRDQEKVAALVQSAAAVAVNGRNF